MTPESAETSATIWTIVERYYRARILYVVQFDRYESLVAQYVERFGKPRTDIRLGPEELSQLIRFKELEKIRDRYLLPLKDACHALFRGNDSTDLLDRIVNDLFHEISILKEENYNVLTYASDGSESLDRDELNTILDEVHEMYPIKVHRLKHLFDLAQARLEKILSRYRKNVVLIRSLFLHRSDFIARAHPDGLIHFYSVIYGKDRAFEGFQMVGDSFYRSGFYAQALDCFVAGEEYLHGVPPGAKRRLHSSWKEAREHFRRYRRLCQDRLASVEEHS